MAHSSLDLCILVRSLPAVTAVHKECRDSHRGSHGEFPNAFNNVCIGNIFSESKNIWGARNT